MTRRPPPALRGLTLTEVTVTALILGVLVMTLTPFMTHVLRANTRASQQSDSMDDIQIALSRIEHDFEEMTLISSATPTLIQFQLDYRRHPAYNATAVDPWGVAFSLSTDFDGDMVGPGGIPVVSTNLNGPNLWDQDDNNNGLIDVEVRYAIDANGDLVRDVNLDEAGWGTNVTVVLRKAQAPLFAYWGSINHSPGRDADANMDGMVSHAEIDANPAAGNANGLLDRPSERIYIDAVEVDLKQDRNGDGRADFRAATRFRPPLLSTNRRV